jgi:5-methylthioadenosine/S-adenosylhomocysteine deaminase
VKRLVASRRVALGAGDALAVQPACLEIDGAHIVRVHPLDAREPVAALGRVAAAQPEAALSNHGDRLITPAFVNLHTHLVLGFLRGAAMGAAARSNLVEDFFFGIERALEPGDVRAFARMGAYESLLAGVGLCWDHYYEGEEVAQALADTGLAGVVCPTLQDLAGPGAGRHDAALAATERIAGDAALAARGIGAALGPHATDTVSAELFERGLALAERLRLPVHLHLAQSLEEVERCRARHATTPARWLARLGLFERAPATVLAHALYATLAELAPLATAGAARHTLVFCPSSQLVFGFAARVGRWSERGLSWAVATDCASNNDSMNVQKELRLVAAQRTLGASWSVAYERLLDAADEDAGREAARAVWQERTRRFEEHAALAEPAALLARIWSIPGRAHPGFVAGELAPGALASLCVWDLDHPALWPALDPLAALAMSDPLGALHTMMIAGRLVGREGAVAACLETDAYREHRAEAARRLELLRGRAPLQSS